jgi:hypothetical protein
VFEDDIRKKIICCLITKKFEDVIESIGVEKLNKTSKSDSP